MRRFKMVVLFFLMVGGTAVMAQQYNQDVPGDDFSLEGALELFKQSASPEEFERKLNSAESRVNNLDLNGDGEIDYIRVIDRNQGNVHAFILQAVLSSTEGQDVAVIELEKLANGKAVLQIIGDEDVYGIETIIEPTQEVRVMAGASTASTVVNVWSWPSVQYVYSPYYTMWVSPWHWYYRPFWWYSWRPVTYYEYYSYWSPYRRHYSYCNTYRIDYARTIYRPYRTHSPVYYKRHETRIVRYRDNHYNERTRYSLDDRSRRTNEVVDRTSRSRYENKRDYSIGDRTPAVKSRSGSDERTRSAERTPVVRERSSSNENKRSTPNTMVEREQKQRVDRKPEMKRSEPVYSSRSEVRNKPTVVERSSPRNERSTQVQTQRSSQQREVKSFDKPDRSSRSAAEVNRSNGNGNDRSNGNGRGNSGGNGKGRGKKD